MLVRFQQEAFNILVTPIVDGQNGCAPTQPFTWAYGVMAAAGGLEPSG